MKIELQQVSKRFIREWIFKNVDLRFEGSHIFAILGANGSGKSTLLRIMAGMQAPSKGKITYQIDNSIVAEDKIFEQVSYCAPAMDVIEEMTLKEFLTFHFSFKKCLKGWNVDAIISALEMEPVAHKFIGDFSSGMKQRAKLAQAFFSDTPFLFLDEPCSNLDAKGVAMYHDWLQKYTQNRMVIIASNDEREYEGAIQHLAVTDFKP